MYLRFLVGKGEKILFYLFIYKSVNFENDLIVLKSNNNLTRLEESFGFFTRPIPLVSSLLDTSHFSLKGDLIRLALNQRKGQFKEFI